MARARNIKPGFFRNADLVELPFEARLLFIGLWTIADRAGRLEDRPKQIKMELFPADNMDCNELLSQLAAVNMISRYEYDGKRYLQVVNFCKHQNPHRDEKESTIPDQYGNLAQTKKEPCKDDANTVQAPCKDDANTVAIGLIPDSLITPLSSSLRSEESSPLASKSKTFSAWIETLRTNGEKPISGYQPVWDYAEKIGLDPEWLEIAWMKFADRYRNDPSYYKKRYADWRRHFLNAVEGNWFSIWRTTPNGGFALSTVGVQADLATREAA